MRPTNPYVPQDFFVMRINISNMKIYCFFPQTHVNASVIDIIQMYLKVILQLL